MFLYDTNKLWDANTLAVDHARTILTIIRRMAGSVSETLRRSEYR